MFQHAARMQQRGIFDEVRVGFWKEEPSLARCMDGLEDGVATVVPLFMSSGYFTEQVIPREMGLTGPITHRGGLSIRYTAPIGGHPRIADLIRERAREAGADRTAAVAVLGHGTPRNPNSEKTIYEQAERVARAREFAEVVTVFLDQAPAMSRIWELTRAYHVVVVPLFMSDGWHVDETIPEELGLAGQRALRGERVMSYTPAIGTHPRISGIIDALVREFGAWEMEPSMSRPEPEQPGALLCRLLAEGPLRLGQVTVESDGAGFLLLGPPGASERSDVDLPTESFRQWIRQTEDGAYRPLSGALSLRRGWRRSCATIEQLVKDLEVIYPMALCHLHLNRRGRLPVVEPGEILLRQSVLKQGEEVATALSESVTASLCANCVRAPVWAGESAEESGTIPCPEPCSFWVSLYREAAGWGEARPASSPPDDTAGFADFARPGNPVREALLHRLATCGDEPQQVPNL